MLDALRMATGTLTALPVPAPRSIDRRVAGLAMLLAPLAALPLALLACMVIVAGELVGLPALVTATLAVAAIAVGSRGLHLDGLADTADGLSASFDRQRALAIMRRSDAGPMGVVALVLVLLAQVAALAGAIAAGHGLLAVTVAAVASRQTLAVCCVRGVRGARSDGLGGAVAGTVPVWQAAVATLLLLALAMLATLPTPVAAWRGALAAALAILAACVVLLGCTRRLGGITGDVLGGCVEAAMLGALLALAS